MLRRRFEQTLSLEVRLDQEATNLREQAKLLPRGKLREQVLRKARQNYVAAHINEWLTSPSLKAPT
ncbi:tetraacyldisaccharide-1-P 4'-kinase [Bradyrhizobium barranii subsp. barranii]